MKTKQTVNKFITFYIFLLLCTVNGYSQLESAKWVFGNGAGLDFINGQPVAMNGSKINTTEGCASLSDSKGNLLFYTDGISAWNKNNELMINGNNLHGHVSSTQSVIIVPKPGNKKLFYIFTLDSEADKNGFCYSIADLGANEGYGKILEKNQFIRNRCTERIAAIRHRNNRDIWIIIHEYESDAFLAYLLTSDGLQPEPVVSKTGIKHEKSKYNNIGYLKSSFDRKRLALAITGDKMVQVFDFNGETGKVSNAISIKFDEMLSPYGIEFSPNNQLLYIGIETRGKIYQADLSNYSESSIQKSLTLVGQNKCYFGALQLGMDGKIYIAEYKGSSLSVIENPNAIGTNCMFKASAIKLNSGTCMFGLPTFFQEYVKTYSIHQIRSFFNVSKETKTNSIYILSKVYFNFNEATFSEKSEKELKQLASYLKSHKELKIDITGHTDSIGTDLYNNKLSIARAMGIASYLVKCGIYENRICWYGKGSSEPIAKNSTDYGRSQNRRAEFVLKE